MGKLWVRNVIKVKHCKHNEQTFAGMNNESGRPGEGERARRRNQIIICKHMQKCIGIEENRSQNNRSEYEDLYSYQYNISHIQSEISLSLR